jgi:hypothetical protein
MIARRFSPAEIEAAIAPHLGTAPMPDTVRLARGVSILATMNDLANDPEARLRDDHAAALALLAMDAEDDAKLREQLDAVAKMLGDRTIRARCGNGDTLTSLLGETVYSALGKKFSRDSGGPVTKITSALLRLVTGRLVEPDAIRKRLSAK